MSLYSRYHLSAPPWGVKSSLLPALPASASCLKEEESELVNLANTLGNWFRKCLSSEGKPLIQHTWRVSAKPRTSQLKYRGQRWRKVECTATVDLADTPPPSPWPLPWDMGEKGDGCGALSSAHGGHVQGSVFEGWRWREEHLEGDPPSLCSIAVREKLWFWALRTPLELKEEGSFPLNFLYSNIRRGGVSAIFKTWRKLDCVCVCL